MVSNFAPKFISAKIAREMFGLSMQRLTKLSAQGVIRTVKLGESKQSGRLFHVNDIEQALSRLAEGKSLNRRQRQHIPSQIGTSPKQQNSSDIYI